MNQTNRGSMMELCPHHLIYTKVAYTVLYDETLNHHLGFILTISVSSTASATHICLLYLVYTMPFPTSVIFLLLTFRSLLSHLHLPVSIHSLRSL